MLELNKHFLYFIRRIRNVRNNARFIPENYFYKSFLVNGEIAPKGRKHSSLDNKFKAFFNSFKILNQGQKNEFYSLIVYSNDIHLYFEDDTNNDVINLRNNNIQRIIGNNTFYELMKELWSYLSSSNAWEIDKHYEEFFKKLPDSKMCPFCGLVKLSIPDSFRTDYDHIAYKGDYPISSISLKNLAPSCPICNQKYKKTKDVFFDDRNIRRKFLYPYSSCQNIEIDLSGSIIPNTDLNNQKGSWTVSIVPNNDFSKTWEEIYCIKQRYTDAINHDKWYSEFIKTLKVTHKTFANNVELEDFIDAFKEIYNPDNNEVEYHLRYAYFKFLANSKNNTFFSTVISEIA